jgi:hypothetical protein
MRDRTTTNTTTSTTTNTTSGESGHSEARAFTLHSLKDLGPGQNAIVTALSPAVEARATTLGMRPGQIVTCEAVSGGGVRVRPTAHEPMTIANDIAEGIVIRVLDDAPRGDSSSLAGAARDREVALPRTEERHRG